MAAPTNPVVRDGSRASIGAAHLSGGASDGMPVPCDMLDPLLDNLERLLRQCCHLPSDEAYVAVAVWLVVTHVLDLLDTAPSLVITSPLGRSARARLLEVMSLVASRPIRTTPVAVSAISLCRKSNGGFGSPTIFLDEAETIFKPGGRGTNLGLRRFIETCHTRGRHGVRLGEPGEVFVPFAIVCLAGVTRMPAAVEDRSVVIRVPDGGEEQSHGWFRRRDAEELASLGNILKWWAAQNAHEIAEFIDAWVERAGPHSKSLLRDHAAEVWEPMLAIGDLAGGDWLDRVTHAAEVLEGQCQDEKLELSTTERLLRDIGRTVAERQGFIGSSELTQLLRENEATAWGASGLTPTRLSLTLRDLGLESRRDSAGMLRGFQAEELRMLVAKHIDVSDVSDTSDGFKPPNLLCRWPRHGVRTTGCLASG